MSTTIFIIGFLMVGIVFLVAKLDMGKDVGCQGDAGMAVAFILTIVFCSSCLLMAISAVYWIVNHVSMLFH